MRLFICIATLCLMASPVAAQTAPTEEACVAAFDSGQKKRMAKQLMSAKDDFQICSNAACPALVKQKCFDWFQELKSEIPSVVVGAKDANGGDLLNVTLEVDGKVRATKLDGSAISFDPGPHKFKVTAEGYEPAEMAAVLKVGARNRAITMTLKTIGGTDPDPAGPTGPVEPVGPTAPGPAGPTPVPGGGGGDDAGGGGGSLMPMAITGFAVAGVGAIVGGIFGGLSLSKSGDVETLCPDNRCTSQEGTDTLDQAFTFAHVSTAAFIVGGIGLGVGVVGLVLDGGEESEVALMFGPNRIGLQGRF